jgi:glycosyltransferase involved in cell wall biosynthesis
VRILHLGSGFRPMRRGGLVAYIEDLMEAQVARGHEVSYFFSGRFYPYLTGPRLKRWQHGGVGMFEVVNSPLHDHGRQPELELTEPRIERILERLLGELRPDIVHVQELAGLPTAVLDVARAGEQPTLVTLQDYYPLCPAFKLLDAAGRVCLRREVGADCVATLDATPRYPERLFRATLTHDLPKLPLVRRVRPERRYPVIERIAGVLAGQATKPTPSPGGDAAAAFQLRRDVNVRRLSQADRLIAMSNRVAEIYTELGVEPGRLQTVQLTLGHLERLTPRRAEARRPLTFATLGGFESDPKGARLLLDTVSRLGGAARAGSLRLVGFGYAEPSVVEEAARIPGVELRGPFGPKQLDRLLDEVDVGIMPSVWEEAYGYAGIEFLAKGIPVIANQIGGMVDYTREGETGWLNRSCSAEELARIMLKLAEDPRQVVELNEKVLAQRDSIVKPMERHAEEMDSIYDELIRELYDRSP